MNTSDVAGYHDTVAGVTYTAGVTTAVFWGLKVSDICMILSTLATVLGVCLQIFLAVRRVRVLEEKQRAAEERVARATREMFDRVKASDK